MNPVQLFRILTYILLPVALLFACMALFVLLMALGNPSVLIIGFLFACVSIYTFTSLRFLTTGINGAHVCKPQLRDWIRVNAYVCLFVSFMFVTNSAGILVMGPATLHDLAVQAMNAQPNLPANLPPDFFQRALKIAAVFMLLVGAVLLVHIILNFKLMKRYRHIFVSADQQ